MKYRHYAPETKCKLVNFENELDQLFNLNKIVKQYKGNVVIIGFHEHKEKIVVSDGRFIDVGNKDDYAQIAKNIYTALRKADNIKPEIILIEGIKKEGMGIAIMNRLLRTCEYDCLEG